MPRLLVIVIKGIVIVKASRLLMHRIKMKLAFVSIITWEQREIIISFKDDASENNALRKDLKNNSEQGQCVYSFLEVKSSSL